jgi:hypothetical protein
MRQDRIWTIIEMAREKQDQIYEIELDRDQILLQLRGVKLDNAQREAISDHIDGCVAYELSEYEEVS